MRLGPQACRNCKIRSGLGRCSGCAMRAIGEGGADGIASWARCLQWYLNETSLGREHLEFERQQLRDWLAGYDFDFARHMEKHPWLRK